MDAAMADYLARMETAVLSSHAAMQRLTEENNTLKNRIKELEELLQQKTSTPPAKRQRAQPASNQHLPLVRSPPPTKQACINNVAPRSLQSRAPVCDDDISDLIDKEMMDWSEESNGAAKETGSDSGDEETLSEKDQILDDSGSTCSEAYEEQCQEKGTPPVSSATAKSCDNPDAGDTATLLSLFNGLGNSSTETKKKIFSRIAESMERSVTLHVFGWLTEAIRCSFPYAYDALLVPEAALIRSQLVFEFFEFLWRDYDYGKKTTLTKGQVRVNNFCADQLLLLLIDRTFATAREFSCFHSAFQVIGFGPASLATGRGVDVSTCGWLATQESASADEHHNESLEIAKDECISDAAALERKFNRHNVLVLVMSRLIVRVIVAMLPRRRGYLEGYLAECLKSFISTKFWGMGLALLQSLHELVSSDGDRGHLSWNDYDFFAKLLAIGLSCGLFPEQMATTAGEALNVVMREMSKCTDISIEDGFELSLSGASRGDGGGDVLIEILSFSVRKLCDVNACKQRLLHNEDEIYITAAMQSSFLRWSKSTEAVSSPIILLPSHTKCEIYYHNLERATSMLFLRRGIWPSVLSLNEFLLHDGPSSDKCETGAVSALDVLGLGCVADFSTTISENMEHVVRMTRGLETNYTAAQFYSQHDSTGGFDLVSYMCRRNKFNAAQFDHSPLKAIDQYFSAHWGNFDSSETGFIRHDLLGGWRVGTAGLAENMNVRLSMEVNSLRKSLLILQIGSGNHVFGPGASEVECGEFALGGYSITPILLREAVDLLKSCMLDHNLIQKLCSSKEGMPSSQCTALTTTGRNLRNIFTIVSLAAFEQFVFLIVRCSISRIASLTRIILEDEHVNSSLLHQARVCSGLQCLRLLISLPRLWNLSSRSEHIVIGVRFCEACMGASTKKQQGSTNKSLAQWYRVGSCDFQDVAGWLMKIPSSLPAIVINLNRRIDRLSRMMKLVAQMGYHIVRFPAVDGSALGGQVDSVKPSNGLASDCSVNALIPDVVVTKIWDSTLNSTFDELCIPNKNNVLSASERACAMSHVMVWQSIANFSSDSKGKPGDTSFSMSRRAINTFGETNFGGHISFYEWMNQLGFVRNLSSPSFIVGPDTTNKQRYTLVLEDDAIFRGIADSFRAMYIRHIVDSLPSDCDLCYIGYAANWSSQDKVTFSDRSMFITPSYVWQLHGYLLSPGGAKKLLNHLPVDSPVDNFVARLSFEKKIKCLALTDRILYQEGISNSFGVISKQKGNDSDIHHSASVAPRANISRRKNIALGMKRKIRGKGGR